MATKSRPPSKSAAGKLKTSTAIPTEAPGGASAETIAKALAGKSRPISAKPATRKPPAPPVEAAQLDVARTMVAAEAAIERATAAVLHPTSFAETLPEEAGETVLSAPEPAPVDAAAPAPADADPILSEAPSPAQAEAAPLGIAPVTAAPVIAAAEATLETAPASVPATEPSRPLAALAEKIEEAMRSQVDAAVSYWSALADMPSLPDATFLTLEHARRQVGLSAAQGQELAILSRQVAIGLLAATWTLDRPR